MATRTPSMENGEEKSTKTSDIGIKAMLVYSL